MVRRVYMPLAPANNQLRDLCVERAHHARWECACRRSSHRRLLESIPKAVLSEVCRGESSLESWTGRTRSSPVFMTKAALEAYTTSQKSDLKGWKLTAIGFCDPEVACAKGQQSTTIWNHIYCKDIHQFPDAVADHVDSGTKQQDVVKNVSQLLRGPPAKWWINQLSADDCQAMKGDLRLWFRVLIDRWKMDKFVSNHPTIPSQHSRTTKPLVPSSDTPRWSR